MIAAKNHDAETLEAPTLIPIGEVCSMLGGITSMSVYRWLNDPRMEFPRPHYLGRIRYWDRAEIIEWIRSRPRER